MLAICSLANAGWPILVDLQRALSHERSKIVNKAGNASRSPRVFFRFVLISLNAYFIEIFGAVFEISKIL